jgi:probable phosphoglycerate mutase
MECGENNMSLKVYLIRHGETDFNKLSKEWGQGNEVPLNDLGILQARKLSEKLKSIRFDKVISSDLERAKMTVNELCKVLDIGVEYDERIREYDPGEVDPQSDKWIEKYKEMLNSGMSKYDIRPYGGENIWDLIKRVKSFLKDLEKEDGTIGIISHSGVNAALMNLSQGRQKDEFLSIKQDNVCINILEFNEGKWTIKIVNDSSHISGIIPNIEFYKNQNEIKEQAKEYVIEKLENDIEELYLAGDIINNNFGVYDRPYKRYKGSTAEVYGILKKDFKIPTKWKISILDGKLEKYEIGKIKVDGLKHKVNFTIIKYKEDIVNMKKEKII